MRTAARLLLISPCEGCDITEGSMAASFCCPCPSLNAAEDIIDLAHTTADAIADMCHIDHDSRINLAGSTCDAFANALDDVSAELDSEVFMAACGVKARTTP